MKKILTNSLLAFVLVSIGFAAGKRMADQSADAKTLLPATGRHVVVYYLHATVRCVTCNTIEKMTRELLDNFYHQELADGTIQWIEADFQKHGDLAKQFKVVSSCVVVADVQDGTVVEYNRLDDVWTLMKDPFAFDEYVSGAIDPFLEKMEE